MTRNDLSDQEMERLAEAAYWFSQSGAKPVYRTDHDRRSSLFSIACEEATFPEPQEAKEFPILAQRMDTERMKNRFFQLQQQAENLFETLLFDLKAAA